MFSPTFSYTDKQLSGLRNVDMELCYQLHPDSSSGNLTDPALLMGSAPLYGLSAA